MAIGNFATTGMSAILPAFADSLAGSTVYGLLVAAIGAGSLIGSGGAFLIEDYPLGWVMIMSYLTSGLLLITAVAAPGIWATGALFLMGTIPIGVVNVLFFSMVQSALDDAFLGRVTSLMRSVLSGIAPAGGLLGGAVAGVAGSVTTLYSVGGIMAIVGAYYFIHPKLRSLPSVSETNEAVLGIGSAANETYESIGTGQTSE